MPLEFTEYLNGKPVSCVCSYCEWCFPSTFRVIKNKIIQGTMSCLNHCLIFFFRLITKLQDVRISQYSLSQQTDTFFLLQDFYELWPEKFQCKTNGVTQVNLFKMSSIKYSTNFINFGFCWNTCTSICT